MRVSYPTILTYYNRTRNKQGVPILRERFPASAPGRVLLQQPFKYINGVIVDELIRNIVSKIEYVTARVRECASHVRRNAKCFWSASSTRMLSSKTD
ncbi:hypothetical protein NDU88_002400 [Pleurodeles waltl]|uniref:Uncharacterized protein n=1 Tax=Pleurodeles waltl TaxID=8319 RepID=A0AAV7KVK4_PLEWA|nr:hypothetical protein NDU88_002400 [Pleurodeles waltl]